MPRKNNIGDLLDGLNKKSTNTNPVSDSADGQVDLSKKGISNPAIELATGAAVKRASSVREPVLHLQHDQVIFFKYHDRHKSSLDTAKVAQIRNSIERDGQQFPGVVRKTSLTTSDGRMIYELIVGRVRFEASKAIFVFKAFLRELDDVQAAKLMFSENEDRLDISPFERWLSILPIIKDEVMGVRELAAIIGWDPGNLSRSLKARFVYEDCNLEQHLLDVSKIKLASLLEVANLYKEDPEKVKDAIKFIEEKYSLRKDNLFLKSIISQFSGVSPSETETIYLSGSKVIIKKVGDSVTLKFNGLPKESDFQVIIEKLRSLDSIG